MSITRINDHGWSNPRRAQPLPSRASADALQRRLRTRRKVLIQSMEGNARAPEARGTRVSPNVFTTLIELERVVNALTIAIRTG